MGVLGLKNRRGFSLTGDPVQCTQDNGISYSFFITMISVILLFGKAENWLLLCNKYKIQMYMRYAELFAKSPILIFRYIHVKHLLHALLCC